LSRAELLLAAALLARPAAGAGPVVLPVTADTSIACYPTERWENAGGAPRLKLKGNENMLLLDFDIRPLAGRRIARATLHFKPTAPRNTLRGIGLSTVGAAWTEGGGNSDAAAGDGAACFWAPGTAHGRKWAGDGSNVLDVVFGRGGTLWTRTTTRAEAAGWLAVDVDPRLVEACAAGLSHGIAVSDDNGQTARVSREADPQSNLGNNYVFSREQHAASPWLEVEAAPSPRPAEAPADLVVAVAAWRGPGPDGGVEISWDGPADDTAAAELLGYRITLEAGEGRLLTLSRWMHPAVPPAGERAIAHLAAPAGASIIANVEAVGRGGVMIARGRGAGFASAALAIPQPLSPVLPAVPPVTAGQAASDLVWAVPDGVKVNPVTGAVLEDSAGGYRASNPSWTAADHTVRLAALRGEWIAFQLVVTRLGGRAPVWQVTPGNLTGPHGGLIPAGAIRLARVLSVPDQGGGWVPDPLVPLAAGAPFPVGDPGQPIAGQSVQPVYVEWFVPRELPPGRYAGTLEAVPPAGKPVRITIALTVDNAVLPEQAHFVWSLNAYSSPGYAYGRFGSTAFLEGERAAYVMAHDHRTTLAILHYSHSGNYDQGCVPAVTGAGAGMRVKDWDAWDRRFGPLFDGTAFAATSRPHAALDHFYLALCEHYPTSMADGYRWNQVRWEDHWKLAGPIEEGFSAAYQAQWTAVARDYLAHIRARGWSTSFQVYCNDKYFYKQYDPARKAWGSGVSFWLLDEPANPDDFLALRFFGRLLRQATAGDHAHLVFRADVSQPEWSRDLLDRVLDLQVSGGLGSSQRLLWDWKDRYGQRLWTYGDSPGARDTNLMLTVTALDLYARGVDGYVPWLALGTPEQWERFATTSVLYDGAHAGLNGPCASLRLKAYRRAEQDVEYAWLYATRHELFRDDPNRLRLAGLLGGALGTQRRMGRLDAEGAETTAFEQVDPARLEALRRLLAAER